MTTPDSYGDRSDRARGDGSSSAGEAMGSNDPVDEGLPPDARGRTASYEGFGQLIADNVRRSGDLMLEMLAMRDSMAHALEQEGLRERERLGANLADVEAGLQAVRTQIDALAGQVGNLRRSFPVHQPHLPQPSGPVEPAAPAVPEAPADPPPAPAPVPPEPAGPEPAPVEESPGAAAPADAWPAAQVIDVIVHQVHRATVALSLQRYLGALDAVAGVEAREFAEGVLRMQVTARQPLTHGDLDGWTDGGAFTVLQIRPTVVELTLAERDD